MRPLLESLDAQELVAEWLLRGARGPVAAFEKPRVEDSTQEHALSHTGSARHRADAVAGSAWI
jgi:hypothetical protein